jgi:putative membrane protein (TIGR04086 family)
MEYNPRQPERPPSPLEPMGFFTGINWRSVIAGVVVDVVATFAITMIYDMFFVARELGDKGAPSKEALAEYWSSGDGLLAGLLIGLLGTAIGGFYAAYKAGSQEMKHGALVGVGSILLGLVLQTAGEQVVNLPDWYLFAGFAGAIPAGALGGFLAEALKGRRSSSGAWPGS